MSARFLNPKQRIALQKEREAAYAAVATQQQQGYSYDAPPAGAYGATQQYYGGQSAQHQ